MSLGKYVIGVDYGTDSVRAILVNAANGEEMAAAVFEYPRWKKGLYCNVEANQFRQHPLDYIEGLQQTVSSVVAEVGEDIAKNVVAMSIDTTGSTPVVVNEQGTPLALVKGYEDNPNAMFVLWKDHTAIQEAEEINAAAAAQHLEHVHFSGGSYSSEWFWAKLLHVLRADANLQKDAFSCVEHCDWMPFLLTGGTHARQLKRGVCAAGHKGLWVDELGGFPDNEFFKSVDPLLAGFVELMRGPLYTVDQPVGNLSAEWAQILGLPETVLVGVGGIDAHVGAIGGQITEGYLSKVIGTSTCDMMVVPAKKMIGKSIKGISGQVHGSILPGMVGLEAGQAAFGDIYAWFKTLLTWPLQGLADASLKEALTDGILARLNEEASKIEWTEHSELAVDWFNGRRSPDLNPLLKGAVSGLSLASSAPRIFRALVEATCFGSRRIAERLRKEGIQIDGIIGLGGIAKKSPFTMQMMADVMNMPIKVHNSTQSVAFGATMMAATVAGIYSNIEEAMQAMGQGFEKEYVPAQKNQDLIEWRYKRYLELCDFLEKESALLHAQAADNE